MNEQEYIDATNLAKLRACNTILRDVLFMDKRGAKKKARIHGKLSTLIGDLEEKVDKSMGADGEGTSALGPDDPRLPEAIGVDGSTPRRLYGLMCRLGYELLGVVDADHPSRVVLSFTDGECVTVVTLEDFEK